MTRAGCTAAVCLAGWLAGAVSSPPPALLNARHERAILPARTHSPHRLRADMLLGVASVSLSALLRECWVDGYAPVHAVMARTNTSGEELGEQRVQV